jgi:hypothetical protein
MGSQVISPGGARVPDVSEPLSGNPNNIARIFYNGGNGPQRIDVNIGGIGNATGYTATAVAIVEHFDPFANAMVREKFIMGGGNNANTISFAVGDLNPNVQYSGEAKIAIYNLGQHGIGGGSGIPGVPSFISTLLGTFGLYDKLTQSDTTNASFIVTDMGGAPLHPTDPSYITSLARNYDRQIVQQPAGPTPCFAAGTPILMANGSNKPIEEIRIGDTVLAFDSRVAHGRGELIPRKVVRFLENVTDEWMLLSLSDDQGDRRTDMVVTPSHRFLS